MFLEISQIYRKMPQACDLIKKKTLAQVFPVKFAKFLRLSFLQNTSGQLFLNISTKLNLFWWCQICLSRIITVRKENLIKCDQIRSFLQISSQLLKKFSFCALSVKFVYQNACTALLVVQSVTSHWCIAGSVLFLHCNICTFKVFSSLILFICCCFCA